MKKPIKNFEYDAAISFAEEDRNAAFALVLAMEMLKFKRVYYYPDNLEATAGKDLETELATIYTEKAAYAVIFLSPHYFQKPYTRIELAAIRKRMQQAPDRVYLVPVMLAETDLGAYPDLKKLGYLSWDYNPKKIASLLSNMFGMPVKNAGLADTGKESMIQALQEVINYRQTKGQVNINKINVSYGK